MILINAPALKYSDIKNSYMEVVTSSKMKKTQQQYKNNSLKSK